MGGDEIEEYTVKEEMMEIIDLDCAFVMMKYYLEQDDVADKEEATHVCRSMQIYVI